MGRFFGFLVFTFIALVGVYVAVALLGDDTTSATVKLLGPGQTPSQCVERLRPHFEKMEPAMVEIAEAILESEEIFEITTALTRSEEDKISINSNPPFDSENQQSWEYELTAEETEFFKRHIGEFNSNRYYLPTFFVESDEGVLVGLFSECGVPIYEWAASHFQIYGDFFDHPQTLGTALLYRRASDFGELECKEPIPDPAPIYSCSIRLNENWIWISDWTTNNALNGYRPPNEKVERDSEVSVPG